MSSKTRVVTGYLNQEAALAAGATASLTFNIEDGAGVTTFEVPTDFTLVILSIFSTLINGTMALDFLDDERTFRVPASTNTLLPALAFESGKRVTAVARNTGAANSGGTSTYGFLAVLVPSVDYDVDKFPETVYPFTQRPV